MADPNAWAKGLTDINPWSNWLLWLTNIPLKKGLADTRRRPRRIRRKIAARRGRQHHHPPALRRVLAWYRKRIEVAGARALAGSGVANG